jgi:hypothetical protein
MNTVEIVRDVRRQLSRPVELQDGTEVAGSTFLRPYSQHIRACAGRTVMVRSFSSPAASVLSV